MLKLFIQSLFWNKQKAYRELIKFAQIEYKKESPDYIVGLISSGQIFKN